MKVEREKQKSYSGHLMGKRDKEQQDSDSSCPFRRPHCHLQTIIKHHREAVIRSER